MGSAQSRARKKQLKERLKKVRKSLKKSVSSRDVREEPNHGRMSLSSSGYIDNDNELIDENESNKEIVDLKASQLIRKPNNPEDHQHEQEQQDKQANIEVPVNRNENLKEEVSDDEEALETKCQLCFREYDLQQVYFLEICGHGFCTECIYSFAEQQLLKLSAPGSLLDSSEIAGEFACPLTKCGCKISMQDLKVGLKEFGHVRYATEPVPVSLKASQNFSVSLTKSLELFIGQHAETYIICPNPKCGTAFERLSPPPQERVPIVNEQGKPVSEEHTHHYYEHRFRCRNCNSVFCSSCKTIPYHVGFTCNQLRHQNADTKCCEYCKESLPEDAVPYTRKAKDKSNEGKEEVEAEPLPLAPKKQRSNSIFFWKKKKKPKEPIIIQRVDKFPVKEAKKEVKKEKKEEKKGVKEVKGEDTAYTNDPVYICTNEECINKINIACLKRHKKCGHRCGGIADERACMKCLHPDCVKDDSQTSDDFCNICWVEDLGSAPSLQLSCGHVFHYECLKEKLKRRWPTPFISFAFADCPLCQAQIVHVELEEYLEPLRKLQSYVKKKAAERMQIDRLKPKGNFANAEDFAMATYTFYLCFKCKAPYFGGRRDCAQGIDNHAEFDPKELVCAACSSFQGANCRIHGEEYIQWKCRFCCSVATFFCGGKTHFCTPCHDKAGQLVEFVNWTTLPTYVRVECKGPEECPLGIQHPPNGGEEFMLKCEMCRVSEFLIN